MFLKKNFAHENMKKWASKVAKPAQISIPVPKNLSPRDFSIMTLVMKKKIRHKIVFRV
jgi:hypothetical protein